jgi:hypothetical protein
MCRHGCARTDSLYFLNDKIASQVSDPDAEAYGSAGADFRADGGAVAKGA